MGHDNDYFRSGYRCCRPCRENKRCCHEPVCEPKCGRDGRDGRDGHDDRNGRDGNGRDGWNGNGRDGWNGNGRDGNGRDGWNGNGRDGWNGNGRNGWNGNGWNGNGRDGWNGNGWNNGHDGGRYGDFDFTWNEAPRHWRGTCDRYRFRRVGAPADKLNRALGHNLARRTGQEWYERRFDVGAYGEINI